MKMPASIFLLTLFSVSVGCAATPQAKPSATPSATASSSTAKPTNDAIVAAIASGKFDEVEALKKKGVSIDALSTEGMTGLMKLAEEGNEGAVHRLLKMGAQLEAKNAKGETAIWYAVYGGHETLALDLISRGALVDGVASDSKECLIHAATKAQLSKLVDVLKTKTPSCLTMKNADGKTPTEIAKGFGDETLAKKLVPKKK